MWSRINAFATTAFDAWLAPMRGLPPALQVCATAVPVAAFALLVFRYASNQEGIRAAKDRIKGHLLEMWLYKDSPGVLLRAQAEVFLSSLEYLGYSLTPLAVMFLPLALVIIQVEAHFAHRGLNVGESVIITATVAGGSPVSSLSADLEVSAGVVVETAPLRLDERGQVLWRIRADAAGEHVLGVRVGAARSERRVVAGGQPRALATTIYHEDDWRMLGHPAEPPLAADSAVTAIEIGYPSRSWEFLGLSDAAWWLLGVSMVLGFALRGFVGVTF